MILQLLRQFLNNLDRCSASFCFGLSLRFPCPLPKRISSRILSKSMFIPQNHTKSQQRVRTCAPKENPVFRASLALSMLEIELYQISHFQWQSEIWVRNYRLSRMGLYFARFFSFSLALGISGSLNVLKIQYLNCYQLLSKEKSVSRLKLTHTCLSILVSHLLEVVLFYLWSIFPTCTIP